MKTDTYLGIRRSRPRVCLGDVGELDGKMSCFDVAMPSDHPIRLQPRKWWEWDYIADCAEQIGVLSSSTTALGLGVGDEPLIFYFANKCKKVIASDLYSAETAWKEARFSNTARVLDASPIPYPRDKVQVINADMRNTGVADRSIDLVWSCSSIEHVPTLVDLFAVFKEIDRILCVGGHAILTTEFCVTENPYLLPGVNAWNPEIFDLMVRSLPGFEMVGEIDLSFNSLHPGNAAHPRRYLPISSLPGSSKLMSYNHRAGTLANPVGLSIIVPIAFVIRKTSNSGVVDWDKASVPDRLRTFSDGMRAFFAGDNDVACNKLQSVYDEAADDLQMRHLAFRFMIDARARRQEARKPDEFADRIEQFLEVIPAGPVQDADCLDICAYLIGECGRTDRALTIYERCLASPSTSRDHVFELSIRYLALAADRGSPKRATEVVISILADLMQYGMNGSEMEISFFNPAAEKIDASLIDSVRRGVSQTLSQTINNLKV